MTNHPKRPLKILDANWREIPVEEYRRYLKELKEKALATRKHDTEGK